MANAVRALSVDMVEEAQSGHPGMPLGAADLVTLLFTEYLKYDPANPHHPGRDRFVLSAGHASALLYATLHLVGYPLTLDEIRRFRQLGSPTSGHPEYWPGKGIECTTGPLGQGVGMAVGMAVAASMVASRESSPLGGAPRVWVLAGDGCLMEGISHEVCSLAGHLGLPNLTLIYDSNGNTIDGGTELAFSENQLERFDSYGWATKAVDGHDFHALREAYDWAVASDRPTFIEARTRIGRFSPLENSHKAHGTVLGAERAAQTRRSLDAGEEAFEIQEELRNAWLEAGGPNKPGRSSMPPGLGQPGATTDIDLTEIRGVIAGYKQECDLREPVASRTASGEILERITATSDLLVGGSADLTGPTCTLTSASRGYSREATNGNYLFYGVREHGMGAIMNGLSLHGPFVPYGGTFLAFADYMKPAIRLSALMERQVIYVMTHDTIGLGEDGPTHQPIEQLSTYRSLPNLLVLRPADRVEVAEAWEVALERTEGPSMLVLARQAVAPITRQRRKENHLRRGGYLVRRAGSSPEMTLISSGTEVAPSLDAAVILEDRGVSVDVVSLPSLELFLQQSESYRSEVLRSDRLLIVEAAATPGWERLGDRRLRFHGMHRFGASGTKDQLFSHFGYTPEGIVEVCEREGLLKRSFA